MVDSLILAVTLAGVFLIAGSGLYVLTGLCGQISLAQSTYMAIGALVSSYFARSAIEQTSTLGGKDLPFVVSAFLAILITGFIAAFFGLISVRLRGAGAISASLAVSVIILYVLERLTFLSGGSRGAFATDNLTIGSTNFLELEIGSRVIDEKIGLMILVLLMSALVCFYARNITRSPLARAMRTVRERDQAAQTCAISPVKTIVSAHFICGLFAGAAGVVYAPFLYTFEISSANPWIGAFGIFASMQLLAYLVIGGMKKYWISCAVIIALVIASSLLSDYSSSISWLDSGQDGVVSPSQITAIVSSVLVIGIIHITARISKNRL